MKRGTLMRKGRISFKDVKTLACSLCVRKQMHGGGGRRDWEVLGSGGRALNPFFCLYLAKDLPYRCTVFVILLLVILVMISVCVVQRRSRATDRGVQHSFSSGSGWFLLSSS